jgi:hypothetical protein
MNSAIALLLKDISNSLLKHGYRFLTIGCVDVLGQYTPAIREHLGGVIESGAMCARRFEIAASNEAPRLLPDVAAAPPMSRGEWRTQFIHTFIARAYRIKALP